MNKISLLKLSKLKEAAEKQLEESKRKSEKAEAYWGGYLAALNQVVKLLE